MYLFECPLEPQPLKNQFNEIVANSTFWLWTLLTYINIYNILLVPRSLDSGSSGAVEPAAVPLGYCRLRCWGSKGC